MKAKKLVLLGLLVAALLTASAGAGWSWAQDAQTRSTAARPVGTAITYQGRLTDGDAPADGRYDLRFQLWDAGSGGNPVGSPVDFENYGMRDGLFTGLLDFEAGAFNGDGRWLAVGIRPWDSKDHHEFLEPRQQLTAAPYALFAKTIYRQTVVVKPAGAPTENGVSLIGALAAITDASADKRYLLKLEPGFYDVGNLSLVMKEYVDIEGSGMDATVILGTGSSSADDGTVWGADNAELRFLTVRNEGDSADWATAIYLKDTSPRITDVQALASKAGSAIGVRIEGSHPTLTRVTAVADGTDLAAGVYTLAFSHPTLEDVTASARNALQSHGVHNEDSYPTMKGVTAYSRSDTESYGVYNLRCILEMVMDDVEAYASRATNTRGVYNEGSNPEMHNVFIEVSDGELNYGLYNQDSSPVMNDMVTTASNGDNNFGLVNDNSSPVVNRLTATASGGSFAQAVTNRNSSGPTMSNVVATASGGTNSNHGLLNDHSSPVVNGLTATASGGSFAQAVTNRNSSRLTMSNVVATASDAATGNYGLVNEDSTVTVNGSMLTASGTSTANAAVKNYQSSCYINNGVLDASGVSSGAGIELSADTSGYRLHLNNSQITVPLAYPTLRTDDEFTIRIGATLLSGGDIDNQGGSLKCAGVYDEAYDFYADTCP
jgi:hypothetical protein